jgi:hypothetical protein
VRAREGFVMAGFTAKKQGLHDLIGGSLVVAKQQRASLSTRAFSREPSVRSVDIQKC